MFVPRNGELSLKRIIYPQRSPRLTHGGACFFPFSGWNSWPTIHYESLALKSNPIKRGCFCPHDPTKTTMRHVRISRVSASSYLAQPAHPGMSHSSCHVLLPNPWRRNTMELGELEGSGFDWDLVVPFSNRPNLSSIAKDSVFFISHLASWLRTRRFSEVTFRPSRPTNHWKNTMTRDFPTFSHNRGGSSPKGL